MRRMILLPVSGYPTIVDVGVGLTTMRGLISCKYIERVRIGTSLSMVVDEEGRYDGHKSINPRASLLYGFLNHGTPIVGDVLVGPEAMTAEGLDWVDWGLLDSTDPKKIINTLLKEKITDD